LSDERRREEPSPFEVLIVAETTGAIVTTGGMKVIPHHTLGQLPAARHSRGPVVGGGRARSG